MKSTSHLNKLIFTLAFSALYTTLLHAQTNPVVHLTGSKMRVPLEMPAGATTVSLCGLTPGYTYTTIAVGAVFGQYTAFELVPIGFTNEGPLFSTKKNTLRFTAIAECAEFQVKAVAKNDASRIPMYLSVKCESCPDVNAWKKNLLNKTGAAVLEVQNGPSAEQLIKETLIAGDCFDVDNVSYAGFFDQIGTFSNGGNNIGFDEGIIIATGDISVAPGPNDEDGADAGYGIGNDDADLSTIATGNLYDRASIEFDFTPTQTPVTFQFVFASEEYCEYVGTQYNDVFGFFISGPGITGTKNLAVLPGTVPPVPITINTLNHQDNDEYYVNNQPLFSEDLCGQFPSFSPSIFEVEYDGFTKPLFAVANVIPCQTYRIKLKIADVADGVWDSAVFLNAGSFDGGGEATVDFVVKGETAAEEAIEGCGTTEIIFDRIGADLSQPVVVSFSVGGTATPGTDYLPLDSAYVIPAGQEQLVVPVYILTDSLTEGSETIVLTLDNSCSCDITQKTLYILDNTSMIALSDTVPICTGASTTLTASTQGGQAPFTFMWNIAATTQSITVNPPVTTTYTVTVTDDCGDTVIDSFWVVVSPLIELVENVALCPGGSVAIGDSTYFAPDTVIVNLPGQGGSCDTIVTYAIASLPLNSTTDTIRFCPNGSVTIGDSVYTQPGTVVDTLLGTSGACDTIATYLLEWLPLNTFSDTIRFCPGGSVTIGDSVYIQPGTVVDTLAGTSGACDTIATYLLEWLPLNTFSDTIRFCPGGSVTIGGTVYTQPGTVVDTLAGANGACDSIATYVLVLKPQVTFTNTIAFCPGGSVTIGGTVYTQPGTVVDTLAGANGACDSIATYVLVLKPQVKFTKTIAFCPGDSVVINGTVYQQFGTVIDTLAGSNGACDTIATYVLESLTPAPSLVKLTCPADITVSAEPAVGVYTLPGASTDCVCPGLSLTLTEGLASGSVFPTGVTTVCYEARDSCGNTASCCFEVTVPDIKPCNTKTIGCIKYDLLDITKDAAGNKTYRIRVTNNCTTPMLFAAFQLPNGVTALQPPNNSVYTAPSGREYNVRNPNHAPFYSIRFQSASDSIIAGESDIFKYTLPAYANPAYIHAVVRVRPKVFYETHLSTFNCTITPSQSINVALDKPGKGWNLSVFPNPTSGSLSVDLTDWQGEQVQLQVFDSQGRRVHHLTATADTAPQEIALSNHLTDGLYFLEILPENGEKQAVRFVLQRR